MKLVKLVQSDPNSTLILPIMDTSAITRKWLDIDYTPDNPHPARKLDLYLPESGDGPFPTIIFIHGGAFTGGMKHDDQAAGFVDCVSEGFAVASVEQRLCYLREDGTYDEAGRFPNPLFDFKAAIRFLRANAEQYKLDPTRFVTAGDSAGGYHAIMAAATAGVPAMYDNTLGFANVDDSVAAVVDWFGCGDLVVQAEFHSQFETMMLPNGLEVPRIVFEDIFLGVSCTEHKNLALFASPEAWITEKMPPALLQHGAADVIVTVECTRRIAATIERICGAERITMDIFEDYAHADQRFYDQANLDRIVKWIREKIKC